MAHKNVLQLEDSSSSAPAFELPDSAIHPLLLDVVLNKVFETLDTEELLACRLVCKAWLHNSELKSNLKKKSIIFLRCIFLHTATTKENLPTYFQIAGPVYEHYHFTRISYQNDFIRYFFQIIGPSIKILKLHLDLNQLNVHQFRELIYERVPNLTELNIYNLSHEEVFLKKLFPYTSALPEAERPKHANLKTLEMQEIRSPNSRFMTQFIGTLINLREIRLKVDVCCDWSDQADLWRENSPLATSIIKALEGSNAFKTLKVFRCGKLRSRHYESFIEMGENGLELEIFEVHMPTKNSEEVFNAFINTQRKTLKHLIIFEQRNARYSQRLKMNEQQFIFSLQIPEQMPKLELLQLSKYEKSVNVPVQIVDYTKQCPALKELILLGYSDGSGLHVPSKKCTSLRAITLWNQICDVNIAYILGTSFPNLTKLSIRYPSANFLTALWSSCIQLENLSIRLEEGNYIDEAFSGIPNSIISQWVESTVEEGNKDVEKWLKCNGSQIDKSIRNLKNLNTLKIIVDHDETVGRQSLCDISAYFALKEMNHLRYLELFSAHWHFGLTHCQFFSQDCCYFLRVHLNLAVIHFSPFEGA